MQYPLQIIMCVGHLFGVALYYGTCFFEYRYQGISHSRPEFLYYWVYCMGLNAAWVVLPAGKCSRLFDSASTGLTRCYTVYLFNNIRSVMFAMEQPASPTSNTQALNATGMEKVS